MEQTNKFFTKMKIQQNADSHKKGRDLPLNM